jgi:zinc/manganese transport system permease protein
MLAAGFGQPHLGWNLFSDGRALFDYRFMVDAYLAGSIAAVVAALVGWFMVLRRQTFAGHTLALVGFPGAAGAVLLGLRPELGYLGGCLAAALVIAAVPAGRRGAEVEESSLIGTTQAFALACGFLFATLYAGNLSGVDSLLFGSFLGITALQVLELAVGAVLVVGALAILGRPLLFASIDPEVAVARGVPVAAVGVGFLVLIGLAAAETSQVTGSLLVFALLVMPPATAQTITARPGQSLALAAGIALVVTWFGLAAAYYSPWPIGFWVTSLAFAAYVVARLARHVRGSTG